MNTLAPVREHEEGIKHGSPKVPVTIASKHETRTVMLEREQAEFHKRLWAPPRHMTINNITTYLEVIGTLGEYRERALATLNENTLDIAFHIPHTDEDVPARYIVGELGAPDEVQYHPETHVGKREKLQDAMLHFKQKS